MAMQQ